MHADLTQPREHLARALEADLIGPYDLPADGEPDMAEEVLRLPPSHSALSRLPGRWTSDQDTFLDRTTGFGASSPLAVPQGTL